MNEFNYQYNTLEKLLTNLEKTEEKALKLNNRGIKTEVTIQKSKYGYWNLKLKIYNGKKRSEVKESPFEEVSNRDGASQ